MKIIKQELQFEESLKQRLPKQEKITLNKYGKNEIKIFERTQKAEYTIMLMNGTLNKHLKELQEVANNRVQQIIRELKSKSNLTEDMIKEEEIRFIQLL